MIEEQYVSFETAKLLKEKGFDERCYKRYAPTHKDYVLADDAGHTNSTLSPDNCSAPTQQMAMRWLREAHNICCEIDCYREKDESGFVFCFLVLPLNSQAFYQTSKYSTYEDATEAAIKYCLEHLID